MMTDAREPFEQPFVRDADAGDDAPLDADLDADQVDSAEADRQAAEDGTKVTSASEGDPMDDSTPVDNLE